MLGGAEGNRTPVRKQLGKNFSGRSLLFAFPFPGGNKHPTGIGSFMMRGMGKAYHTHVLRLNHTRARVSGTPGADGRLIRQPGQQYCCQLNLRNCPFYRGQAPRPAIPASLPPSKPVRPHGKLQNTVGILQRIAVLYRTLIKIFQKDFNCPKGILFYETCFVISFLIILFLRAYLKTEYSCTISTKSKWKQY